MKGNDIGSSNYTSADNVVDEGMKIVGEYGTVDTEKHTLSLHPDTASITTMPVEHLRHKAKALVNALDSVAQAFQTMADTDVAPDGVDPVERQLLSERHEEEWSAVDNLGVRAVRLMECIDTCLDSLEMRTYRIRGQELQESYSEALTEPRAEVDRITKKLRESLRRLLEFYTKCKVRTEQQRGAQGPPR